MRKNKSGKSNQVRIIGGEFRSRKLAFPELPELRPTGDRIRETVFNWLAPHIINSKCLDLFAGSGALGIEALSRGATHVTFIDASRKACDALQNNLDLLDKRLLATGKARVICANSLQWLESSSNTIDTNFNIVFLDPPFEANIYQPCCDLLDNRRLLAPPAWIYLEEAQAKESPPIPTSWQLAKSRVTGNVRYQLYLRQ